MAGEMEVIDRDEEDKRIKALVETPSLDWGSELQFAFQPWWRWSRKNSTTPGYGRGGLPNKKPHEGYVCRRCNIPGHFIQHCSTNGDPDFDIKVLRRPRGVPRTMLQVASDGSYLLDSGEAAVVVPDESTFDKEMEGMTSRQPLADIPVELHCPLCKKVMKDAMFTSKCCFRSFCDHCIREYIISNTMCACGAVGVLADDLIPNKTIRETINHYMGTSSSSCASTVTSMHIGNKEPAHSAQEDSLSTVRSPVAEIEANQKHDKKSAETNTKRETEDCLHPPFVDKSKVQYVNVSDCLISSLDALENGQTAMTSVQGAPNGSTHESHWDSGMTWYPSSYNSYMVGCGLPSFMIPPYMAYQTVYEPDPFRLQAFPFAGYHSTCYNNNTVERMPINLAGQETTKLKVVHRPVGLVSALFAVVNYCQVICAGKSPCYMEIHYCRCCTCFCEFDASILFILFMFFGDLLYFRNKCQIG